MTDLLKIYWSVNVASSTSELDSIFKIRHQVLVEEEKYLPSTPDFRIVDRFDAYPDTLHIAAKYENTIVGSSRISMFPWNDYLLGSPLDSWYDFTPFIDGACYAVGSMLCLLRDYRHVYEFAYCLIEKGHSLAHNRKAKYILTVMNPKVLKFFSKMGYESLDEERINPRNNLPFIPAICRL